MESLYDGLAQLGELIVWPYLAIFILLSYVVTKYFGAWIDKVTKIKWNTIYTVFILATLIAIPYILYTDETWSNILLTYAIGTSAYEIILKKLIEKIGG